MIQEYPIPDPCEYCFSPVIFTSNAEIYGREYGNGKCYKCTQCDAYVGVHTGTNIPLGRLANKELRELKKECHSLFDPAWKYHSISRSKAYFKLAALMEISTDECHFGWFEKKDLLQAKSILLNKNWWK